PATVLRGQRRGHLGRTVLHLHGLRPAAQAFPVLDRERVHFDHLRVVPVGARLPFDRAAADHPLRPCPGVHLHSHEVSALYAHCASALRCHRLPHHRPCPPPAGAAHLLRRLSMVSSRQPERHPHAFPALPWPRHPRVFLASPCVPGISYSSQQPLPALTDHPAATL